MIQKNQGGYILKSGCAKKYAFQKFRGGGGGKGDLEKSRFDWVFLNDGVPNQYERDRESFITSNYNMKCYWPNCKSIPGNSSICIKVENPIKCKVSPLTFQLENLSIIDIGN